MPSMTPLRSVCSMDAPQAQLPPCRTGCLIAGGFGGPAAGRGLALWSSGHDDVVEDVAIVR